MLEQLLVVACFVLEPSFSARLTDVTARKTGTLPHAIALDEKRNVSSILRSLLPNGISFCELTTLLLSLLLL
jgi:hypothetical protein